MISRQKSQCVVELLCSPGEGSCPCWKNTVISASGYSILKVQQAGCAQVNRWIDSCTISLPMHCSNLGWFLLKRPRFEPSGWLYSACLCEYAPLCVFACMLCELSYLQIGNRKICFYTFMAYVPVCS